MGQVLEIRDFVSINEGDFLGQKCHSVPMLSPSSESGDAGNEELTITAVSQFNIENTTLS